MQDQITSYDSEFTKHHKNYVEGITAILKKERKNLSKDKERLFKEKHGWETLQKKLETTQLEDRIKLDVGGTVFCISEKFLKSQPGSYFDQMLTGKKDVQKEGNTYFIDRESNGFNHILTFLRTGKVNASRLKDSEIEDLALEATFYQLDELLENLKQQVQVGVAKKEGNKFSAGPNYVLSSGDKTAKYTGKNNCWESTILGPAIPQGQVSEWTFKIKSLKYPTSNPNIMFGIAPKGIDQTMFYNYAKSGWYFYTNGGTLYSGKGDIAKSYQPGLGSLANGATIKMTVDMSKNSGELSYNINGKECGVAWSNIPKEELRVCCMLHTTEDEISIEG